MPDSTSSSRRPRSRKTPDGLSAGILQSVTSAEHAHVSLDGVERERPVEPTTNYFAARLQKDWAKGNTVLGGMLTNTHRWIGDPALEFLPRDALTGALDFVQYFANRSYVLEAKGAFSRITGDAAAITELQRNPVHYYQRPDADHLGLDGAATSLSGHAGTFRFARYGNSKWRWANATRWVSPGFDLNDIGFLRQADFVVNRASGGYVQTDPTGPLRTWGVTVERQDAFDYSGARTDAVTGVQASGTFDNKWTASTSSMLSRNRTTLACCAAVRRCSQAGSGVPSSLASTDPSRRVVLGGQLRRQFGVEPARTSPKCPDRSGGASRSASSCSPSSRTPRTSTICSTSRRPRLPAARGTLLGRIDRTRSRSRSARTCRFTPISPSSTTAAVVSTGRYTHFQARDGTAPDDYANRFTC